MPKTLDKLLDIVGLQRKANELPRGVTSLGDEDPFILWRRGKKIDPQKAFEVYAGWTYACIRAIAEEIQAMEFVLKKQKPDGSTEEIDDHELLDILYTVNNFQTGLELKYTTAAHLEAIGNSYWFLEGVEDETDKPKAIYLLNPARTKILADRNSFPPQVSGYKYRTQTKEFQFEPYQIIHLKYPDPQDPIEGIGTIQSIPQWIDADNYATEFNRRFFLNGARISGFLESEVHTTREALDYIKHNFENAFKGVSNAYKVAALPKGVNFKEASVKQKDMDFTELSREMRDKILAGFRVPRTVLGITDDVNRANAEATNYVFALRTIKPKMELLVSYLNEFLVPRYGDDIFLDFKDPVPENREARMEEMKAATAGQAVVSINEAREEYFGYDPIEGGDAVKGNALLTDIGAPKPKSADRPSKKSNGNKRPVKSRFKKNVETRKEISGELAKKAKEAFQEASKRIEIAKKKDITELSDDDWEILWKNFVQRVEPYEKTFKKKVQEAESEVFKEIKGNLDEAIKGVDKQALFDGDNFVALLIDLTQPVAEELSKVEGAAAAELLGITDLDIITPEYRKQIQQNLKLMAKSHSQTVRDQVAKTITDVQKEGGSLDDLEDALEGLKNQVIAERSQVIARTETFRLANAATHEAWKQAGVVSTVKWYTAADERVCPYCNPLHGKVVEIDKNFFKKGDVVTGEDGSQLDLNYSDIPYPPLHANCRCYIRPEDVTISNI